MRHTNDIHAQKYFTNGEVIWRAKSVITKTYKLTHFTDKLCSCLDKSYRNEKLFSATRQIVS